MSLKLGDYTKYRTGEMSVDQAQMKINETPTPLEMLQKQGEYFMECLQDFRKTLENPGFGHGVSGMNTLLSKIEMWLMEPGLTDEMRKQGEENRDYLLSKASDVNHILQRIARDAAQSLLPAEDDD